MPHTSMEQMHICSGLNITQYIQQLLEAVKVDGSKMFA